MEFGDGPAKSETNKKKHGIDFEEHKLSGLTRIAMGSLLNRMTKTASRWLPLPGASYGLVSTLQEKIESESFQWEGLERTKEYFMKAKDLDKIFDDGEVDINDYLDLSSAFRPGQEQKRVNVDFPVWMIERLDNEANRLGVPRQSPIWWTP